MKHIKVSPARSKQLSRRPAPLSHPRRTECLLTSPSLMLGSEKSNRLSSRRSEPSRHETDAINKPPAEVMLAQIQALFGERDAAIAAIPHLLKVPAGINVADLRFDPFWDPLRKDPRFQKLVAEKKP